MPTADAPLSPNARRLIGARAARSLGQGALVVDFTLYLHVLDWSGAAIGSLLMASLLLGAALTLAVGPLSDRLGRKAFLIAYEGVQLIAAGLALTSSAVLPLTVAAVLGNFGLGANGSAGPFGPAEQAWLSQSVRRERFGRVYSFNAAVGFLGMATGAVLAALPGLLQPLLPGALAYRPLFGIVMAGSLVTLVLLSGAQDVPRARLQPAGAGRPGPAGEPGPVAGPRPEPAHADADAEPVLSRRQENGLLAQLVGINALNGVGIGLVGPLIAYWFALHFGVGPARIGPVLAVAFALSSVTSLGTGWLSDRLGVVPAVVWTRLVALALLVALPLSPTYAIAAGLFIARTALNRGTAGARQALSLSLVSPQRRGLAASLNTISMQIPRAVGPAVAGVFFDAGMLALPFFLSAVFQGGYLFAYRRAFSVYAPAPPPRVRPPKAPG